MKRKTLDLAGQLAQAISSWDGVEAVTLNEAAHGDTLDPHFALTLDVYHAFPLPDSQARRAWYGAANLYEAALCKDRFFSGDIPVRIEFKQTAKIDELVNAASGGIASGKKEAFRSIADTGTYGFYRIVESQVLFSRGEWLSGIRKRLSTLGLDFWGELCGIYKAKMEHFLSDLGAALLSDDNFYFLVSSAEFIKSAALTLFCINRRFEPSHRFYYNQLCALPLLPDSFDAQIETFLRPSEEMTMERKYGVAGIIARGILALPWE
ncbi:MAG: DUF4037 domain-containing protein [Spirochaetaceae bacterium]|nr:DUF4037 domain-containing protein [Spirochaetaceae bacterium]